MRMQSPTIDPAAVRARAQRVLLLFWPQLEPHLREVLGIIDSPMSTMALKSLGALMPKAVREGLHLVLSYLRGCKELPSAELQDRVGQLVAALPDEDLARWGGVLAWVLTGS